MTENTEITTRRLEGRDVMSNDGHNLGEVQDLFIDTSTWRITGLEVKLRRDILEDLNMKKPLLGSTAVKIPVSWVNGIGDSVILKSPLNAITFPEEE